MAGGYLCLEADVEIFMKCLTKESNTKNVETIQKKRRK